MREIRTSGSTRGGSESRYIVVHCPTLLAGEVLFPQTVNASSNVSSRK
jgi:hypothetical protein